MKVFSYSAYMSFWMSSKFRSRLRLENSPPRISSQLGPQTILSIWRPSIRLRGRAVGEAIISGADCRCA
jgi:hypothetical protein